MEQLLKRRTIITALVVVIVLLAGNIYVSYTNSREIDINTALQNRSEKIKIMVSHIGIDIIHNLDLGIRSYALFRNREYLYPFEKALERKDSILSETRIILMEEGFDLKEFDALSDSIEHYVSLNRKLKHLIEKDNMTEFMVFADQDLGYHLWLQYEKFTKTVNRHEDSVLRNATARYEAALQRNYIIQIVLFLICVPTLLITTVHAFTKFKIERKLRDIETERTTMLASENERLEKMVIERIREITAKNRLLQERQDEIEAQNEEMRQQNEQLLIHQEEIALQRDMLSAHNIKLAEAQEMILQQQAEIREKNELLEIEVDRKTKELVQHNQQLEQFAFVAAHNLRGPVARVLGLSNVLKLIDDRTEEKQIVNKIIKSISDLDVIIKDLNTILEIKNDVTSHVSTVHFAREMEVIMSNLEKEILETKCVIKQDFSLAPTVVSIKAYIDSILYNLISNAVKYRNPEHVPEVTVTTTQVDELICLSVTDNGLGIDLDRYGKDIFSLYKRFHTHTEGKGLGLHLVKVQATAIGGYVNVSSSPGAGTTFLIYLKNHISVGAALAR